MRKYVPSDYMVDAITNAIDERDGEYVKVEDLPRWIPVSERLPEVGGRVLIYCPLLCPHEVIGATFWEGQTLKGWWTDDVQQLGGTEPTHWMKLPEPPEVA